MEGALIYPIYRKYKGISVWFKIMDERNFIEIKKIGTKYKIERVEAVQYPEMVLIKDMIDCFEDRWEPCEPVEFEQIFCSL